MSPEIAYSAINAFPYVPSVEKFSLWPVIPWPVALGLGVA